MRELYYSLKYWFSSPSRYLQKCRLKDDLYWKYIEDLEERNKQLRIQVSVLREKLATATGTKFNDTTDMDLHVYADYMKNRRKLHRVVKRSK